MFHLSPKTVVLVLLATLFLTSCATDTGRRGTLLLVGGGLDNDNAPVYHRFLELAKRASPSSGPVHLVVATAATGPEDEEATDKSEALRTWCPEVDITVVRRETSTADTVAAIDAASAMFFTGGDQKRITARYRPGDRDTPEWLAMQRLLQRGGVIAGASAGDAMMGDVMFLTGSSARSLGVAAAAVADSDGPPLGPQMGPGMKFLPWLVTESHFFERDRIGRLVAGLEASGRRLGIGVGEDAAVEVDLASGELTGVSVSAALLVDADALQRDGLSRRRLVARLIQQGDRVSVTQRIAAAGNAPTPRPAVGAVTTVPVVEPGQNRQLASWRLFHQACEERAPCVWQLRLDGWRLVAWHGRTGECVFDLEVDS